MNNKMKSKGVNFFEPWVGKKFSIHRDDPHLELAIKNILELYYCGDSNLTDILDFDLLNKRKDIDVINIDIRFNNPDIEDQDYSIFRAFKSPQQLILDVGANWGYSVIDILALGASCKIFSFEPVKFYEPLLNRISDLRPAQYGHKAIALSDQKTILKFMTPVINNLPIYALSSATTEPNLEVMTKNILYHIRQYMSDDIFITLKLHEFESLVDTLDNQIKNGFTNLVWSEVVAIKIDVEGLEFAVLRGAINTLMKHTPLIMLEGGNRWLGVTEFMKNLGYRFAERSGDKLDFYSNEGVKVNGFFVHKNKIAYYKSLGILN